MTDRILGWIEEIEGTMVSLRNLLTAEEVDLGEIKHAVSWARLKLELMDCSLRLTILDHKEAQMKEGMQ